MMRIRKKTLDKATENAISQAAAAGIPLPFDRYEDQVPVCRFGQMGLDCKACTQGPCRVNPFDTTNGTACGRDREGIVSASFLRLVADGAVANATFAGVEAKVAGAVFGGISAANEGTLGSAQLLQKAIDVADASFKALPAKANGAVKSVQVGIGALNPDKINILLLGSIPAAQAAKIARELGSNPKVNLVGAVGGEVADVAVAGNYNSQEALLVTTAVDAVVAGNACVAPGFMALAAKQGVPVVGADKFNAASLLDRADTHFRQNAGRSIAARFAPIAATVGFSASTFASLSAAQWGKLADSGIKGVAIVGGCNNAIETQDAAIVRQASEFLKNDVLVIASGCAAAGLAKAGFMDPAKVTSFAGKGLQSFLSALSQATGAQLPAALEAGSCWEIAAALELARLFQKNLTLPTAAAMPEVSRPAAWSSALALAAQGVPTYVGPVLPLDGGLQTVQALNEMLKARGGSLVGPGQVGDPEAFVKSVMSNES
ncbi:MAG: anaerobic carbon-monoxide dehydrogenase catalytic subunit [Chloroflexota bacterium]